MVVVSIEESINCDLKRVWNVVTSLLEYEWRSDLEKIKVVDEKHFVEYAKGGYATKFSITEKKQHEFYSFEMENDTMKGHWMGTFERSGDETKLHFVEEIEAKKWFVKPFVKMYLKKQQKTYMDDLKQKLCLSIDENGDK